MKKINHAHICAYLSLAISILIALLWCCNVGGFSVINLDSFVGVIVALLAIIVTLVVGWQIYNSIEVKNKIEKLCQLENDFSQYKETTKQQDYKCAEYINILCAYNSINKAKYCDAFICFLKSLCYAIQQTPISSNLDFLFEALKENVEKIGNESPIAEEYLCIAREADKEIRSSTIYPAIKMRYEEIYDILTKKMQKKP